MTAMEFSCRSGMKSVIRCSVCVFDGFWLHTVTLSQQASLAKQAASFQLSASYREVAVRRTLRLLNHSVQGIHKSY